MSVNNRFPFRIFYFLNGIEAIVAIIFLAYIPTDPKNVIFLGFSLNRLIIFGAMLAILGFSLFQLWKARDEYFEPRWFRFVNKFLQQIKFIAPLILLACLIVIIFPAYRFGKYEVIYSRVQPLIILLATISFQFLILLKVEIQEKIIKIDEFLDKRSLGIFFVAIISIWVFLVTTRIGLDIDHDFWGGAATPILPLVLIVSIFVPFYLFYIFKDNDEKFRKFMKFFPFLLFLLAIVVWNLEPFTPHFFAPKVRPPNYEYYPYSDAQIYDMTAQTLLNGEGYYNRGHVQRPLYGFMLFIFHKLVGQEYLDVILLQTVLYAIFPVLIFYLGKRFFSPVVGISFGLLAVLRELTALQASPYMEIVHSKLYMTDNWAGLFALLITLLVSIWYFDKKENNLLLILIGGVMGISLLMRINLLLVFLPVFFVVILKTRTSILKRIQRIVVLGLSIFIFLLPWMLRNYVQVGEFGIEPQKFRMVIETRFTIDEDQEQNQPRPGSSKPSPMIIPEKIKNDWISGIDTKEIVNILKFSTANFLHNEIHSILIFPNSIFAESITGVIEKNDYIQESWVGEINLRQFIAIIINLCLIGLGISLSYKKIGWFGLFPLAIHLFYNLSNGIARVSGWRYVLVTDWIVVLYYLAGLLFVVSVVFSKLNLTDIHPKMIVEGTDEQEMKTGRFSRISSLVGIILVALVSVGMILPEVMTKPKYEGEISKDKFRQVIESSNVDYEPSKLEDILTKPDVVAIHSKAFYPRYYEAGEGEPGINIEWMLAKEFNQVNFMIISPYVTGVNMNIENPPENFPHNSEVFIIGKWVKTQYGNYLDGKFICLPDNGKVLLSNFD